jgi:hypothetical protein
MSSMCSTCKHGFSPDELFECEVNVRDKKTDQLLESKIIYQCEFCIAKQIVIAEDIECNLKLLHI